jgi:transketolase
VGHLPEGRLGAAVPDVFADARPGPRLMKLAVPRIPGSATSQEQLHEAGLDAVGIARAALALVRVGAQAPEATRAR